MQWTQYELAADSWQELQTADPTMLPASTRVAPVGPCQLQLDGQALVVQPERGTDLWPAMKQGKRPGQDPDARDRSTETWLAFRLAKLSSAEEKYTLLRAAVCEHPPSITGLSIVLEIALEWGLDLSAYVQTPEGLFSLPALVLHCNKFTNCDPELSAQVVSALCHLVDIGTSLKMPARLSLEREPDTTLAHEVVFKHHSTDVLTFLRSRGAELDLRNGAGRTPLLCACGFGNLPIVQQLLQCGADINIACNGYGVLHAASSAGHVDVVRYLLSQGIPADHACMGTATPLHIASQQGYLGVVRLLHSGGADVHRVDADGKSAFSFAYRGGHAPIVSYLRGHKVEEHVGRFGLMKKGHSLPEPKKKPKRHKRLTPLRERAERAGVLHRFKVTPPGLRERAEGGSVPAKKQLQALHKHNHQVVDRSEVAAAPDQLKHLSRLDSDARSHRKRKLQLAVKPYSW